MRTPPRRGGAKTANAASCLVMTFGAVALSDGLALLTVRPRVLGGPSFWVGLPLSAFAAEWGIHRTARQQARVLTRAS